MTPNLRLIRIPMLAVAVLVCLALAALAAESADAATRSCKIDQNGDIVYLPDSTGNVYYIRVTNTSCAVGNRVVRGFYRCRRANGRRGTCKKRVARFRCTEKRTYQRDPDGSGDASFVGRPVSCRTGSRRVVFSYKQNL